MDDQGRDDTGGMASIFADEDTAVEEFFSPRVQGRARRDVPAATVAPAPTTPERAPRPTHYKVISISLYTEDLERLDQLVADLRARGHTRANKSMVIREALRQIDLDRIPGRR